ncbi:predicted protein [Postia placenta Mad-698-R]|nr:predicted protein [Postia placenta Mad-698-R]
MPYNLRSRRAYSSPAAPARWYLNVDPALDREDGLSDHDSVHSGGRSSTSVWRGLLYSRVVTPEQSAAPGAPTEGSAVSSVDMSLDSVRGTDLGRKAALYARGVEGAFLPTDGDYPDNGGRWHTVTRSRRSRSLDPMDKDNVYRLATEENTHVLTTNQREVIRTAEGELHPAEQEHINRRFRVVHERRNRERPESKDEGPSMRMDKGKGIDPRNWGNAEIAPEDLDIEAQKRAYAILANPMALLLDEAGNPLSIDKQREALEYWGGLRKVPQSGVSVSTENNGRPAGASTNGVSVDTGRPPENAIQMSPAPLSAEVDPGREALEQEISMLKSQLTELQVSREQGTVASMSSALPGKKNKKVNLPKEPVRSQSLK